MSVIAVSLLAVEHAVGLHVGDLRGVEAEARRDFRVVLAAKKSFTVWTFASQLIVLSVFVISDSSNLTRIGYGPAAKNVASVFGRDWIRGDI
ncbi:hypothetical protein [Variovorax sp.]|uniref:hypothetical protein n=1 Tax=Variovorax sp. TaxID=1871043 RepID=UPI003BA99815